MAEAPESAKRFTCGYCGQLTSIPGTIYTNTKRYAPPCCPREACIAKWECVDVDNVAPELLAEAQPYESPFTFAPPEGAITDKQTPQAKRRPS